VGQNERKSAGGRAGAYMGIFLNLIGGRTWVHKGLVRSTVKEVVAASGVSRYGPTDRASSCVLLMYAQRYQAAAGMHTYLPVPGTYRVS
jgi:hypothetical protein